MPSKEVEFHEEALAEAQAAYDWYATRNAAAAEAFIGELDHAVERIGMLPEASTSYVSGTRRYVLKRFPFTVIYREQKKVIQIVLLPMVAENRATGKRESKTE